MILVGDCLEQIKNIESQSVQTCITSPPYWGLRDYGHDGQVGLEETPEEYVAKVVQVFAEVKRVMKDDGTLWLNLGDSYAGSGKGRNGDGGRTVNPNDKQTTSAGTMLGLLAPSMPDGLKPKDLIGIPWRVAFALQADGWYLRQDIIWAKPNPMPESVKDRCTKSHEYLFLLSKSPKYYYDNEAIKEPAVTTEGRPSGVVRDRVYEYNSKQSLLGQNRGGNITTEPITRNKRDVWTVNAKPFKGAHFATMPEALVEPCVLAGSREGDIVLDPFLGSGTVAVVAERHRRNWIGCELNPDYAAIAETRIESARPEMELFR
jgi:DNA modification methylase